MVAGSSWRRWTPLCGVLAIGAVVFGLSLELQGAPTTSRDTGSRSLNKAIKGLTDAEDPALIAAPGAAGDTKRTTTRVLSNDLAIPGKNVYGPFIVDYRDDEGTRLREAGLLKGPLPMSTNGSVAGVTAGGCTFGIECLDGDPCTIDTCEFPLGGVAGSGTCVSTPVDEGQPGGCGDGVLCNGTETCQINAGSGLLECTPGLPATCCAGEELCTDLFGVCDEDSVNVGDPCANDTECREGRCDPCKSDCSKRRCESDRSMTCTGDADCPNGSCLTNDEVCSDGIRCNGDEICDTDTGECFPGINPCGEEADCVEKRCVGLCARDDPDVADPEVVIRADPPIECVFGNDCPQSDPVCDGGGFACGSDAGCPVRCELRPDDDPIICFSGRCCKDRTGEPQGSRQNCDFLFPKGGACLNPNGIAGVWYPGDDGREQSGGQCPCGGCNTMIQEDNQWGCPQISAGINHTPLDGPPSNPIAIGPISDAPFDRNIGTFTGPLNAMGDDWTFVDLGDPDQHFAVEVIRFIGNVLVPNRLLLEFYDADNNFIEDLILPPLGAGDPGVIVVVLEPPFTLPPSGFFVIRVAGNFSPNASFQWFTSGRPSDIGTNNANLVWLNGSSVPNFFPNDLSGVQFPGVMAFEMAGDPVDPPFGACCDPITGVCDAVVKWICDGRLPPGVFQEGLPCAECVGGENAGNPCRTCQGGSEPGDFACASQADCVENDLGGDCLPNNTLCASAQGLCTNDDERLCDIATDCLVCSNDSFAEDSCLTDTDCVGRVARCSESGAFCQVDDDCTGASNICGGPGTCGGLSGRCSATLGLCENDNECPGATNTCGGTGTCSFGTCESATCGVGSCCLDDGTCVEGQTQSSCTTDLSGTFGGFGTTCVPNCCKIPGDTVNADLAPPKGDDLYDEDCTDGFCFTGADQPADAINHIIHVPAANEEPVVVTITGNNTSATSTAENPDTCFGEATNVFSSPGWWELFSLDGCGMVRVDLCCTKPIHEPQWSFMSLDVDCNDTIGNNENPFKTGEAQNARGAPHCDEDNLWMWYPFLTAGKYYVPIFSELQGHLGQYQLHITVEPCPIAACCTPGGCVDFLTQIECDEIVGSLWLGRPQRGSEIPICTPGICDEGSCCTAPGVCKDTKDNNGFPMTSTICEDPDGAFNGVFTPNVQCAGGRCALNTDIACETSAECTGVGGPGCQAGADPDTNPCCLGDPAFLAQPSPCPICEHIAAATCQLDAGSWIGFIRISDISSQISPVKVTDDVMPTNGGILEEVCVIGNFRLVPGGGANCPNAGFTDEFTVIVFANLSDDAHIPGEKLGEFKTMISQNRDEPEFNSGALDFFRFQLALIPDDDNPLVELEAGVIYWIQVFDNTQGGDEPTCDFWWLDAAPGLGGNGLLYQDQGSIITVVDASPSDTAICLNLAFSAPPPPVRACCTGDTLDPCRDETFEACDDLSGQWLPEQPSCATGTCANDASISCIVDGDCTAVGGLCSPFACEIQRNDLCEFAPTITEGAQFFDLFGTATEGPSPEVCEDNAASVNGDDVWYFYTPTKSGTALISTCNDEFFGDTVISVYRNSANPSQCPCPEDADFEFITCQDSDQDNFEHPTGCPFFGDQSEVLLNNVAPGLCFTIRVAGFGNAQPPGILRISFADGPGPECGDGIRSSANGEQCDGTDDALCAGECSVFCLCPTPICGDNIAAGAELGEACDGSDDSACPTQCRPRGDPFECTCPPVCGNNIKEPGELCDGTDSEACPGSCRPQGDLAGGCTCITNCGNDMVEVGEPCDGTDDDLCPGGCIAVGEVDECTCPPAECGNDIVELALAEECDGEATEGAFCGPEECRPPNDPAGECTCACGASQAEDPPEGDGICEVLLSSGASASGSVSCSSDADCSGGTCVFSRFDRALVVRLPESSAGNLTAYRLSLVTLYDPSDPQPLPPQDFSANEGTFRYLNLLLDENGAVVTDCESSAAQGTTYPCITTGCTPEFANWGMLFGGRTAYVSGNAIIPDSTYTMAHLSATCTVANAADCSAVSAEVTYTTARYGDVQPDGLVTVADVVLTVDVVKQLPGSAFEYQVYIREVSPAPQTKETNVGDIVAHVDALKLFSYQLPVDSCP